VRLLALLKKDLSFFVLHAMLQRMKFVVVVGKEVMLGGRDVRKLCHGGFKGVEITPQ
jgi:hypothetical protein